MAKTKHKETLSSLKVLLKEGRGDEALAGYQALIDKAPGDPVVHLAYAAALAKGRRTGAETHFRRALELSPGDPSALFAYGNYLTRVGRFDEALEILLAAADAQPDDYRRMRALALAKEGQGDYIGAAEYYRRAIELAPADGSLYAEFAAMLNRHAQAVADRGAQLAPESADAVATHGVALSRLGRFDEAVEALERADRIEPGSIDLRRELLAIERLRHTDGVIHRRAAPWPTRDFHLQDYEKAVRRYVLGDVPENLNLLTRSTKVATMGSCFAIHIAQRLEERGLDCFYKLIAEDINSTYANSYLLDWVRGVKNAQTEPFDALYGNEERADWEKHLRECDLFIFSLGLGTSFFDRETGEFVPNIGGRVEGSTLAELYRHRATSVAENVVNVRHIIDKLRDLNADVKIVLTVSPVALGGTYERRSAVSADCVSKSTLRLTVEEILALGLPDVYYWPSFEMVRWLGAHVPRTHEAPFGSHDGRTRHVSPWLQELIVGLFVDYCGDETMRTSGGRADIAPTLAD